MCTLYAYCDEYKYLFSLFLILLSLFPGKMLMAINRKSLRFVRTYTIYTVKITFMQNVINIFLSESNLHVDYNIINSDIL